MTTKFDKIFKSMMTESTEREPDEFTKEWMEQLEGYMAQVELNLSYAGELMVEINDPFVEKRAGELGAKIQEDLHNFMDNFGGTSVEDAERPMDRSENITEEINSNGSVAAEAISNIYSLVEEEGQEMLDKQAAEKLKDIKEFVSNLLRNLNNRL